jgi:hypothetical protein
MAGILEVYVRGESVPEGAPTVIELEQGGTYLAERATTSSFVRRQDVVYHWFRFLVVSLE